MLRFSIITALLLVGVAGCTPLTVNDCACPSASDVCAEGATDDRVGLPDYPGC